jgi:hypothetical protein
LEIARKCDLQTKETIVDNIKYFEILTLSKQALTARIPVKSDPSALKNSEEALSLRKELENLDSLKEKCMEIVHKIFNTLNEDNVIPQFIKVLQKKSTEKAVFAENKARFEELFKVLESISSDIVEARKNILLKNEIFSKIKALNFKPNEENEKFFRDLENYANLYNQKLINLNQGSNFYNEFYQRMNDLNGRITDYLLARDMEKNELIKAITSGQNISFGQNYQNVTPQQQQPQNYNQGGGYLDPNSNQITNLHYSYHYQYGGKGGYN